MKTNDKKAFFELWKSAREEYNRPVTSAGLKLAYESLKRFEFDDVQKAVILHFNDSVNGKFPIQISHVAAQLDGGADTRALDAWNKLSKAVTGVGHMPDIVFDDHIIHKIISDEGGWYKVCSMSDDDFKFLQNRFNKIYCQYVSRSGVTDYPKVLVGLENPERLKHGLEKYPPVVIGDVDKARDTYRLGKDGGVAISGFNNMADVLEIEDKEKVAS